MLAAVGNAPSPSHQQCILAQNDSEPHATVALHVIPESYRADKKSLKTTVFLRRQHQRFPHRRERDHPNPPPLRLFAMAAPPSAHATISVSSGYLCFGSLHNIWNGASSPLQGFPSAPARPQAFGTVKTQPVEFNIVARKGTWNAFQLVDLRTSEVAAWFLAHSGVDPEREVDKILRVSGSPYEPDSGSVFHDDKTAAEGVFVINRYDWGYYDNRSKDEVVVAAAEELDGEGLPAAPYYGRFEAAGLVDLAAARSMVLRWKDQPSREAQWSEGGAWLHVPGGEYMFGRFGFDDDRAAARSFLFFTTNTDFTRTVFKGQERTLRKEETTKERFERRLQEGYDFSGLEELCGLYREPEDPSIVPLFSPPPPPAARLGPYPLSDHVFRAQDINAIRIYGGGEERRIFFHELGRTEFPRQGANAEFIDPWAEPVYDLVNEMILSFLQRTVFPHMGNHDVPAAAELLFPQHHTQKGKSWHLDAWCYRHFTQPNAIPIPDFDSVYVGGRIASFLSRLGDATLVPVVFEDECVAGITRAVAYLICEVLELADLDASGLGHRKILPRDVRMGVYKDKQLYERLQFSRVFWEGRAGSGSSE